MLSMFKFYYYDSVRLDAAKSMPHLLECAHIRGEQYVFEIWSLICNDLIEAIDSEPEQEVLAEMMTSFSKCIDYVGPTALNEKQIDSIIKISGKYLSEHFTKREHEDKTENQLIDEVSVGFFLLIKN